MLRVMLVDDEPYILQGLQIIVDWEREGYEIVALMTNGQEALEYLKNNTVDLIISDIQMPVMNGLELLEKINEEKISDARFVVLTGYDDFSYTQKAIRSNCHDYILKPVKKEELLSIIRNVSNLTLESHKQKENQEQMQDAFLRINIISLIKGKYDESNIDFVNSHLQLTGGIRFIDIEVASDYIDSESDDYDLRLEQKQLYSVCREVLKDYANHFIFDVSYSEDDYDIGFIYCENMADRKDMSEEEFLITMHRKIEVMMKKPIRMLCGKMVSNISAISKSYSSCHRLNSIKSFHNPKSIYVYEDEVQVSQSGLVLCKNSIDEIINAIENNEQEQIELAVDKLYSELQSCDASENIMDLNLNYLLFQLIHLASEQDDSINQEEIVEYISENAVDSSLIRGSSQHMKRFATEYANYLMELRKSISRGILAEIEAEIRDHYSENISLKYLGDKYHINSSYLGQVFKKKYDMSFKNYLTNYRIKEAAKMVISTDKKINQIAEEVGYKDCDYFIRKFIEIKGCTPSKYRKNNRGE